MTRTALVLGGGGITGIAWELGILKGLADAGVDLSEADLVVGTSAGSVVGTQLASGRPLQELYATQLAPPDTEIGAELSRPRCSGRR
jgi:NTE family protein